MEIKRIHLKSVQQSNTCVQTQRKINGIAIQGQSLELTQPATWAKAWPSPPAPWCRLVLPAQHLQHTIVLTPLQQDHLLCILSLILISKVGQIHYGCDSQLEACFSPSACRTYYHTLRNSIGDGPQVLQSFDQITSEGNLNWKGIAFCCLQRNQVLFSFEMQSEHSGR